jgi:hypothetical protein
MPTPLGSESFVKAPAEYFTGTARIVIHKVSWVQA